MTKRKSRLPSSKSSTPSQPLDPNGGELASPQQEIRFHQSLVVSPIPPPDHLSAYKEIQADIPERLLRQLEHQGEHRRAIEMKALMSQIRIELIGLFCAFIVVLGVVGLGSYLMISGQTWPGGVVLFGSLAGLARLFVSQQRRRGVRESPARRGSALQRDAADQNGGGRQVAPKK